MNDAVEQYVKTHSKSQAVGFILTLLFGPLGLFYSSWVAGLILCVIAVATVAFSYWPHYLLDDCNAHYFCNSE